MQVKRKILLGAQLGGACVAIVVSFVLREAFHVQRDIAVCIAVLVGAAALIGIGKVGERRLRQSMNKAERP